MWAFSDERGTPVAQQVADASPLCSKRRSCLRLRLHPSDPHPPKQILSQAAAVWTHADISRVRSALVRSVSAAVPSVFPIVEAMDLLLLVYSETPSAPSVAWRPLGRSTPYTLHPSVLVGYMDPHHNAPPPTHADPLAGSSSADARGHLPGCPHDMDFPLPGYSRNLLSPLCSLEIPRTL